jgi:LmbE family N-acetylglucosaminyl deacetylase
MADASAAGSFRPARAAAQPVIYPPSWPPGPATATRRPADPVPAPLARGPLPRAENVLAVIARPGQESAELGALLHAFRRAGARLALLSVTRGEASPLNSTYERLETVRPWELEVAARLLGVSSLVVADYPDGELSRYPAEEFAERIQREIRNHASDLLLVTDPATGGTDETVLAMAVCSAAEQAGVPAVVRAAPGAHGGWLIDLGAEATAARAIQRSAAAAHASQSEALPGVRRHLDLLDTSERVRWLVLPDPAQRHSGADGLHYLAAGAGPA